MGNLTIKEQQAISQFKTFLFKQKEEFVKGYYDAGKVFINIDLSGEVIHLKNQFGHVIFNDFKDYLRDKFITEDLERLKVEIHGLLDEKMLVSLEKE